MRSTCVVVAACLSVLGIAPATAAASATVTTFGAATGITGEVAAAA
jgi:hypothetical protein